MLRISRFLLTLLIFVVCGALAYVSVEHSNEGTARILFTLSVLWCLFAFFLYLGTEQAVKEAASVHKKPVKPLSGYALIVGALPVIGYLIYHNFVWTGVLLLLGAFFIPMAHHKFDQTVARILREEADKNAQEGSSK